MRKSQLPILLLSLITLPLNGLAESGVLEEIVVTATKRSENLQEIPVTVTAFSADAIQDAGIEDIEDVAVVTPSLGVNVNTNPFNARMSIRGIGTSQNDPALEPSVGMFVDGVYIGRSGLGMSDLVDIERIEVLQGPQGTLYGKNTNAGAISVVTTRPNLVDRDGHVGVTVGNYGLTRIDASVSGPVSDTVAYRLTGSVHERDGIYDNAAGDDMNDIDDWNVRGKLLWQLSDALDLSLSVAHVDRDTSCCAADAEQIPLVNFVLGAQGAPLDANDPYDYDVAVNVESRFNLESDLVSLSLNYETDNGLITSISGWNDYDYSTSQDPDRSQLDIFRIVDNRFSGDSFSQELRYAANLGESLDYQVGLFYFTQTTQQGGDAPFAFLGADFLTVAGQLPLGLPVPLGFLAQPGDSIRVDHNLETETLALFSQATWHLDETLRIKAGLRWTDEEKDADLLSVTSSTAPLFLAAGQALLNNISTPINASFDRSTSNTDWLLSLSKDLGEDTMLFASVATGTKSGGFNTVSGSAADREFDDEETINYELGVKTTLLDSRLRLNLTLFHTEIEDYQSQQQLPSGAGTFVSNFGEVEVSGVDLQVEAMPMPNLFLSAGLLYLNDYEVTKGVDDGLELAFTAEISGNLAATYAIVIGDGEGYLRADYSYMDDHSTNSASANQLRPKDFDDRTLLNFRLGWRNDHWDVSLWGKNLTEDDYASVTTVRFPFSGMDAYFLAPPKTYGASLRYEF